MHVDSLRMELEWTKVQLYACALHDGMLSPQERPGYILRGFDASCCILETFERIVEAEGTSGLSGMYGFATVCAWMFVFKVWCSQYRMYLDVDAMEKVLAEVQGTMIAKSVRTGDFCWRSGVYMEHLLRDSKSNDLCLGMEPCLTTRSRMAAGLYFDGLARVNSLLKSRERSHSTVDTKVILSPPPSHFSSSSSPFLSSDGLSTPPISHIPPPSFTKPMFSEIWTAEQTAGSTFVADPSKFDMDWLADSFLTGEDASNLSAYVSPGLLVVQ
jgi:hypothetical protein